MSATARLVEQKRTWLETAIEELGMAKHTAADDDDKKKDLIKEALKEGIKEWMNEQFARFGKYSFYALASMGFAGFIAWVLIINGWHR